MSADDDGDVYAGAWCTVEMECVICGHEWVAVFPEVAPALECGGCGYMNGIPPFARPTTAPD